MRGFRGKISGSKIGNSGNKGGHRGLTRAGRSGKVVDAVDAECARARCSPGMRRGIGGRHGL